MAITTLDEARELVAAGAVLLDRVRDDSWWEWDRIDLDQFDMGGTYNCVLGQLYGDYFDGQDVLSLSRSSAALYGFGVDCCAAVGDCFCDRRHSLLTEAWREHITARRSAVVSAGAA